MNRALDNLVCAIRGSYESQLKEDFKIAEKVCVLLNELRDKYEKWALERPEDTRDRWLVSNFHPYCYFAFWSIGDKEFKNHHNYGEGVRVVNGQIFAKSLGSPEQLASDPTHAAAIMYDFKIKNEAHDNVRQVIKTQCVEDQKQ